MNLSYLKVIRFFYPCYHSKLIADILKKYRFKCGCMINGNENEAENKSHTYDINRPRPRYGHKHTKYKNCLIIMIIICIKKHPSDIWGSIYENVKQTWGGAVKKNYLNKQLVTFNSKWDLVGWGEYILWVHIVMPVRIF